MLDLFFSFFLVDILPEQKTDDDGNGNDDNDNSKSISASAINKYYKKDSKDNLFREFRRICAEISNESSFTGKTKILHQFLLKVGMNENLLCDNIITIE